jgi:hypothetical protein
MFRDYPLAAELFADDWELVKEPIMTLEEFDRRMQKIQAHRREAEEYIAAADTKEAELLKEANIEAHPSTFIKQTLYRLTGSACSYASPRDALMMENKLSKGIM